jgi:hypothetical protein
MKVFLMSISLWTTIFSCLSQGQVPINNYFVSGALEFLPDGTLAEGANRIAYSREYKKADPKLDPNEWYEQPGHPEKMRGFVSDAVLFFEWWLLTDTPEERYKFNWTNSGYFELLVQKKDAMFPEIIRINRSDLEKYPNLQERFDNIKPIELVFQLDFRSADIEDQPYWDFRHKYNIMEDLGSAGYSVNYSRTLDGDMILYQYNAERYRWTSRGIPLNGWDGFLNFNYDKYKDKRSRLIELFRLGNQIAFSSFYIKKITWEMADFAYIVRKYQEYEKGIDKPTAEDVEKAPITAKKAGGDLWDDTETVDTETEPFLDPTSRKFGIQTKKKRSVVQPKYDQMVQSTDGMNYLASIGNTVYLLNRMGTVINTKTYPSIRSLNGDMSVTISMEDEDISGTIWYVRYGESESMLPGKGGIEKYFSMNQRMVLFVENTELTYAEREAQNAEYDRREREEKEKAANKFRSMGYKKY